MSNNDTATNGKNKTAPERTFMLDVSNVNALLSKRSLPEQLKSAKTTVRSLVKRGLAIKGAVNNNDVGYQQLKLVNGKRERPLHLLMRRKRVNFTEPELIITFVQQLNPKESLSRPALIVHAENADQRVRCIIVNPKCRRLTDIRYLLGMQLTGVTCTAIVGDQRKSDQCLVLCESLHASVPADGVLTDTMIDRCKLPTALKTVHGKHANSSLPGKLDIWSPTTPSIITGPDRVQPIRRDKDTADKTETLIVYMLGLLDNDSSK